MVWGSCRLLSYGKLQLIQTCWRGCCWLLEKLLSACAGEERQTHVANISGKPAPRPFSCGLHGLSARGQNRRGCQERELPSQGDTGALHKAVQLRSLWPALPAALPVLTTWARVIWCAPGQNAGSCPLTSHSHSPCSWAGNWN